jgi:hypothetical protein
MSDENTSESKIEYAQVLFSKTRNATPAQIQKALSDIGNAIVTIKRGKGRAHYGASFICMETQEQQEKVLENGFKIDFTKEQLAEQNEQIKAAIERSKKELKDKGASAPWIREFDPDREIDTSMTADIAKFTPPRPGDKDRTLYLSDITTEKSKDAITAEMKKLLNQIGGLESLTLHEKRSTDAWEDDEESKTKIYFAFAEFSHTNDAQSAYLMMKDYEYEPNRFMSCNYANSKPRMQRIDSRSPTQDRLSPSSGLTSPSSGSGKTSPMSGKKSPTSGKTSPAPGKMSPTPQRPASWRKGHTA